MRIVLCLIFPILLQAADLDSALQQFQLAKSDAKHYPKAAALFAKAAAQAPLTAEQNAAWAYCRIRIAAEQWNASRGEQAKAVIAEVQAALALVPEHEALQAFGNEVLAAAGGKPLQRKAVSAAGWYTIESANFRVRFQESRKPLAEKLSKDAETLRAGLFEKWSGPAPGAWTAKCEIVLHPDAKAFAESTKLTPQHTGHALVQLEGGQPTSRRIDLRADDANAAADALPRELMHIVLADLFPAAPPPRWAVEGMALLAMSPATVERYLATAKSLARRKQLPALAELFAAEKPLDGPGYPVASLAVAEYLVRKGGERSFTIFLRDARRYGFEKSLERQYEVSVMTLAKLLQIEWDQD
jgi:hypothetical protein